MRERERKKEREILVCVRDRDKERERENKYITKSMTEKAVAKVKLCFVEIRWANLKICKKLI